MFGMERPSFDPVATLDVSIPKYYGTLQLSSIDRVEIHAFSDAGQRVIGVGVCLFNSKGDRSFRIPCVPPSESDANHSY